MVKKVIILSLISIFSFFCSLADAIPAFPGAEGAGKNATGGRGGQVLEVINLDDSGTGSLRWALDRDLHPYPRIIVFRVSGTIELLSALNILPYGFTGYHGDVTIAGQTAPGDGITLKNKAFIIGADNVIVRYIRVRLGEGPVTTAGRGNQGEVDALTFSRGHDVILDHVSSGWSVDESMSFNMGADVNNVTFQWCMISEGLDRSIHKKGPHSKATLLYLGYGHKVSFHHNIYAHQGDRNPRVNGSAVYTTDPVGGYWDFRNNVVYNWGGGYAGHCTAQNTVTHLNIVNNYYKRGVDSTPTSVPWQEASQHSEAYVNGNWLDGTCPADQWTLVRFVGDQDANQIAEYKQSSEIPVASMPTDDTLTAYNKVLADAGCTVPYRDSVDNRVVGDIQNGTGEIIDCTQDGDFYCGIYNAVSATSNTLTLSTSDFHILRDSGVGSLVGYEISILSGTGSGQTRNVINHTINGTVKIVTVSPDWDVIPDSTSRYGTLVRCAKHAYGWPVLTSTTPPADGDHDGMPNAWETARGLNPTSAADGPLDGDSDGYTNVEEYLNYLAEQKTVLPPDFDRDGDVDNDDLDLFTEDWLKNDCNNVPRRNLDTDCDVDFSDYAIVADYWMEVF